MHRFGNRIGTALATALVLLISSIVVIQGETVRRTNTGEPDRRLGGAISNTQGTISSDVVDSAIHWGGELLTGTNVKPLPYSQSTEHQSTRDLVGGQTSEGPITIGDHYPIRISSIDDASQIKPEVERGTRWVYHLCHPGASFINVHFAEFGKLSLPTMLVDFDSHTSSF
jgi:hypothetical protein